MLAMPKKKIFLFILYVGMISFVNAQIQKVSGKIMNDDGTPLSGVTISVKGTKTSTQSMNDGNFTINIPEKVTKVLVFSFIGYTPKEVAIKNNLPIIVTLSSATNDLDDVVVIGYGTQRKRDLTGSVAKVNITELQKAPVRSFEEALGGRVAGVQVTSTDGQPGSPVSIVIRGNNSITQDNSPLYVVDGFPIENPNNNAINPSDIESIEVLKDASATAIYGARAANGVIMITTKKGVAGKTKFSFNTFYGFQDILNKLDVLSPYDFVRYQFENDSTNTKSQYLTGGKTFESYRNVKGVDWQDQVFRQAPIISNSLSMSGGNAATKYFLSLSGLKQDGIVKFSGYDRYQGRFRFDQNVNEKMKVGMNINYSALKSYGTVPSSLSNSSSQSSNLMYSVWGYRPNTGDTTVNLLEGIDPLFENDPNDSRFNPLETITYEQRNRYSNTLYGNLTLEYELIKNLKFKALIGYTNDVDRNEEFNGSNTRAGSPKTVSGRANGVNGSYIYNTTNSYVSENTISYFKKLNKKNTIDVVGGFTFQGINRYSYGASASKLPNERLGLAGLDEGIPTKVNATKTNNNLASFLGRVNYSYDGKYLATVSFRADGSSKFSPDNKWSYFPSGSLAWRLSQEKFMKSFKFLNDAKFRTSYGLVNGAGGNIPEAVVKQGEDIFSLDMNALNKALQLNLFGTLLPTQVFGKSIAQQKSGSIVNVSSASATRAITRVLGYSLGKSAIDCYTRWMAVELANRYGDAIRMNAIMPGFFLTEQNRTLLTNEDGSYTERGGLIIQNTPYKRMGKAEELKGTLVWLLSDASKFVSGTIVAVDGGFMAFSGV